MYLILIYNEKLMNNDHITVSRINLFLTEEFFISSGISHFMKHLAIYVYIKGVYIESPRKMHLNCTHFSQI